MCNGSVTPREESFGKQTQVVLLGGWLSDVVASCLIEIDVKLEPWLRRYSWKTIRKVFSIQKRVEKSGNPGKRLTISKKSSKHIGLLLPSTNSFCIEK